ncbi:pectate lyase [Rhizomicrobium palustre]
MLGTCAEAAVIGTLQRYPGLKPAAIAVLPAERRTAWEEYLKRSVAAHKADMAVLEAERKGMKQFPGPPDASYHDKSMPLDKAPEWYGSEEARRIAGNIVSFQTPAGGWGKNQDFTKGPRLKGQMWVVFEKTARSQPQDYPNPAAVHWHYTGTIDNDATTTQLRFLAKTIAAAGEGDTAAWKASFLKGLDYLFAAELPSGGWPQIWPLEGGYSDAITYNDDAFANTASLLADVTENAGGFYGFVPAEARAKAKAAVKRARAVILSTQVVVHGTRTVWGQQHDALTLSPVAARNFEPAMLSATESADLLLFLMKLPDPSTEEVRAIHAAARWLQTAAIPDIAWEPDGDGRKLVAKPGAPRMWARFYDPQTMKPVFGDVDKTIHDNVNEISAERRAGYSWYNTGPEKALKQYAQWAKTHPAQ